MSVGEHILDGSRYAAEIRDEVAATVVALGTGGIVPRLDAVLVGEDPASQVYVASKARTLAKLGMISETHHLAETATQAELDGLIDSLNDDPDVDGILVQLPLPRTINSAAILRRIDPAKDVDGFHPVNVGKLSTGETEVLAPCTPAGVVEMLVRSGNDPSGKHCVIVGRSNIVGRPMASLLLRKAAGGNATVTVCHSRTPDLGAVTQLADILIVAIGWPEMVKADMVRPGAVVVDVGVNRVDDDTRERGYRLVGDVAFDEVKEIASAITPVPGGVGPMTITMLMTNTVDAAVRQAGIQE